MKPARVTDYLSASDQDAAGDSRQRYEEALVCAMQTAERYLPRDEALEIAHNVACAVLRFPADRVTGAFIYVAVTNGLRVYWRSAKRRAAREGAYHDAWSAVTKGWAEPGAEMAMQELQARVDACIAAMPQRMREVFLVIREEERTYKEAAAQLGISVGTVHTQFSRATALLRQCVAAYRAGDPSSNKSKRNAKP